MSNNYEKVFTHFLKASLTDSPLMINHDPSPLPLSTTLASVTALNLPEAGKYDFNLMCQKWRGKLVSNVWTKILSLIIDLLQDSWPPLQIHISLYPTSSKAEMINITFLASTNHHHQSNYTGLCCFLYKINSNVIFSIQPNSSI